MNRLRRKHWLIMAAILFLCGGVWRWSAPRPLKPVLKFRGIQDVQGERVVTMEVQYEREGHVQYSPFVRVRSHDGALQLVDLNWTATSRPVEDARNQPITFTFALPPTNGVQPFTAGVDFIDPPSPLWRYVPHAVYSLLPPSVRKDRANKAWSETITP